tara:strand:+ start:1296 stop:1490 length:195 start_codon:yes stop_codon:yes gene_type:complete
MASKKYVTREEFDKFVESRFYELSDDVKLLTVELAKLSGGQKVALILLTAIVGLVATVMVAAII